MGRRTLQLGENKNYALALKYRLSGLTYLEIGTKLNVSRQRAQQILRPPKIIYDIVKKKASNRCQNCGLLVKNGHVHHAANRDFDFNSLQNLQYLCISCHKSIHILPDERVLLCKRCNNTRLTKGPGYSRRLCLACSYFKICKKCKKEFVSKITGLDIYCKKCRYEKRPCKMCGKIKVLDRGKDGDLMRNKNSFCDRICQGQYLGKTRGWKHPLK